MEENCIFFHLNDLIINLECHILEIRLLSGKWWFVFPRYKKKILSIDKPNKNGGYDTIMIDGEIFDDLFTMDDNQLVLIYGKFYPDYLSGDQTELYNTIVKHLDTN